MTALLRYLAGGGLVLALALGAGWHWQYNRTQAVQAEARQAAEAAAQMRQAAEAAEAEVRALHDEINRQQEVAARHAKTQQRLQTQLATQATELAALARANADIRRWAAARLPDCLYYWLRAQDAPGLDPDPHGVCADAGPLLGADADPGAAGADPGRAGGGVPGAGGGDRAVQRRQGGAGGAEQP